MTSIATPVSAATEQEHQHNDDQDQFHGISPLMATALFAEHLSIQRLLHFIVPDPQRLRLSARNLVPWRRRVAVTPVSKRHCNKRRLERAAFHTDPAKANNATESRGSSLRFVPGKYILL
jgi:hypothetical protein